MPYPLAPPRATSLQGPEEVVVEYDDTVELQTEFENRAYLWRGEIAIPVLDIYQDDPAEVRLVYDSGGPTPTRVGFASTSVKPVALDNFGGAVAAFVLPVPT